MLTTLIAALMLAAAPDCAALYRTARPDAGELQPETLRCEVWPTKPEFTILVAPTERDLELFVLKTTDGTVVAHLVDVGAAESFGVYEHPKFALDTAKYRGPDGAPAFGVRKTVTINNSRVAAGNATVLNLYALKDVTLRRVLGDLVVHEYSGPHECVEGCDCHESTTTTTLWNDAKHRLVMRAETKGWEDVAKKSKCVRQRRDLTPKVTRLDVKDGAFVLPTSPQ